MNVWRSSPDLYLPLFSPGCSPTEDQDHHDAPLVALIKTYGLDNERDRLLRFPSPVDEQDADLLLHFASSPLSAKTPASSSSQSTAHTPNSRSSTSDDLDDGDRPPKKRALSPFTPQDFDKAYPLHYLVSPPSVSPVIRTSSPDGDSSNCSPDSVLYLHFKKRRLREISETPRKSLASSFLGDLSPLSSVSSISSISSVLSASSEESPLASRSHSSFVGTRDVTESPLGKMVTSSRVLRASRGSLNRRSLPTTRAVGSPAYRRRKLESVPRPYPAPRSQQVAQDMQEKIPLEKKHRLSSQIATETIDSQTTQQVKDSLKIEDSVLEDRGLKLPLRTFPPQVKLHHYFPLFYIRYPIYSCSKEDSKRYIFGLSFTLVNRGLT